ncbi:MAG TPA: UvrD-helicase domain-containing protein [Thermoanaerobaculia bacterium]|nr:UvrD-helicase domain-containing protein [Thermoanaerobaculia bacterium]
MTDLLREFRALSLRDLDREARRAAQTRFDRPLVLEAGAGTGKTTTLIGRLLAWTLGPGWEKAERRLAERVAANPFRRTDRAGPDRLAADVLSRVVAITFTEAAAAEMAGRAARELGRLAAGEAVPDWLDPTLLPEGDERALRARALLGTLDHLSVRTIHAFCRGLLADHPLEAGVHPDLAIDADGRLVEEVVREVVENALREGYGTPGDPSLLTLAAQGFGPQEVVQSLLALLASGLPSAALGEDPFRPEAVLAFRDRLAEAAGAVHGLIAPRLRGSRLKNAREIERGLGSLLGRIEDGETGIEALRDQAAELLPENLVDHLRKWTRRLDGTEASLFGEVGARLAAAAAVLAPLLDHLGRLDPELLGHGRRALRPLLAAVESEMRSRGIATFDFLLTGAEALLARHPDVRRRVRRGIDQLLVDEFQDTDRIQCEVLRWIALDGPPDERPGLFLVGDPKQSIYGWRSADLRAYAGFVALVRQNRGEVMPLALNFRSVPAILDEVARVVAPVMVERPGLQPPFEPLLPCERRAAEPGFVRPGRWAAVEHWVSWAADGDKGGPRTPAGEATEIEAAALAEDVRSLHEREGVAWREMAVLLRGTGDLDIYLEALRRARVPFAVGRDKQYYRRREVIEAAALVRAVLDPGDHLALLTVLRSASVGVPDAALIPLWNGQLPRRMTELHAPDPRVLAELADIVAEAARSVPRDVPGLDRVEGWERNLLAAIENLAVLRRSFATDPADVFVERLRRLSLLEATEAARYLGPYRLANLDRFFRQLLAAIDDGGDVNGILRALRRSVAEAREAEEGRPKDGAEDAVGILTIHGAKGLDFEHVYLVQLHKTSPGDRGPRTEAGRVDGGPRWEYRLFGAPTLGFDLVEAARREVEAAERVRLLYVAMTRAKDRLVLAGVWPDGREAKPPELARTHMELLTSRPDVPADLAGRWEKALARAEGDPPVWAFPDPAGALWKLPALRPQDPPGLSAEPEAPSLPTPEEVALASERLRDLRDLADARMARSFGGAASEEAHELLREQQAERLAEAPERPARTVPLDRAAAMAAGGAVHRALEEWDLAADPVEESGRQRDRLPAYLAGLVEGDELDRALPVARDLLETFAAGPLLPRLRSLKDHLVARELPVLLPPGKGEHSPVGVVSGTIDLLYNDPKTGRSVIADYKTDEVEGGEEMEARAAVYAPQGAIYTRAIKEALELKEAPRFELWFLRVGRIISSA